MRNIVPVPCFTLTQKIRLMLMCKFNWNIPTYTTANELFVLYDLASGLKEQSNVLEIGSYIGASSIMIAKGLKKGSKLYCVDTWQNDAMTEGNWDTFTEFKKNTKSVESKIICVRSNSNEASNVVNEELDMIFIDGDHSYDGVKNDFDCWFHKLKTGGIIVFHDIEWAEGVQLVVNENVKPLVEKVGMLPNLYWAWKK